MVSTRFTLPICFLLSLVAQIVTGDEFVASIPSQDDRHQENPEELNVTTSPTVSAIPSFSPTTKSPSNIPTSAPTSVPTNIPSTKTPSFRPTLVPSVSLSIAPTNSPSTLSRSEPSINTSYSPSAFSTISPSQALSDLLTKAPTTSTPGDNLSVVNDRFGFGMITALGVSGVAIIVTAVVIQRRRMLKDPAVSQVISDISPDNHV